MQRFSHKIRSAAKNGFTLIELLVVISIIAILSSIVLASLANARAGANIAAGEQFDSSSYDILGVNAIASWNFSEGSGTSTLDSSYERNNLQILNSSDVTWTTGPNGSSALKFDGMANAGLELVNNGVGFDSLSNNIFTVTAWVNTSISTGRENIFDVPPYTSNNNFGLNLDTNGPLSGGWGIEAVYSGCYVAYTDAGLLPNKWYDIAYTKNGPTDPGTFYVDGHSETTVAPTNCSTLQFDTNSTYDPPAGSVVVSNTGVGGGAVPFTGSLSDIRVYDQAMTAEQIWNVYAEEAPKYSVALAP